MVDITIGTVTYQSFASVEFATEYLGADFVRAPIWNAMTDDLQKQTLVTATRMLLTMPWCDGPPDPAVDQPEPVPSVTARLAVDIYQNPDLLSDASGSSNIKSVGAGSAKVEFFSPVEGAAPLPMYLWTELMAADLMCPNGSGSDDLVLDGAYPSGTCGGERPLWGRYPWDWPVAEEDYD